MNARNERHLDRDGAVLITDADSSPRDQLDYRRRRYAIMMGTRIVCLALAAAFYHITWLTLMFACGAVALPWAAVLMANDRLPKQRSTFDRADGHSLPAANGSHVIEGR